MYKPLVIGDLVAKVPLIQGGMGVGVSLSSLAGAVAKEGGIGIISTAQIGFKEPDFDNNFMEANMRAIDKHVKRAKEIAGGNGAVGVNIMVATKNYPMYVKQALESGVDLIISGAGLPLDLPKLAEGYDAKLVPIVSSKKSASVICRMWDRKCHTAPDAVVIEGPKAGGHLGFHYDQLEKMDELDYDTEIRGIIEVIKTFADKYDKHIPVIIAGGISTKEDVRHAMELGAEGVQVATRFVVTEECDVSQQFKDMYLNCKKEDIAIIKSPVGLPGRAIRNAFIREVEQHRIAPGKCHGCISTCKYEETPYCITDALVNSALGDCDHGLVFCGADAYKLHEMTTVKAVIDELMNCE